MSARTKARLRAIEVLFEAEARRSDPIEVLERRRRHSEKLFGAYTEELVRGVMLRQGELDDLLQSWARGWTLSRMPAVDRTVLRVGAWELLFNDDVPDTVAIDEAVSLVKQLSTDGSPSFVNGLLGRLQKVKPTLVEEDPSQEELDAAAQLQGQSLVVEPLGMEPEIPEGLRGVSLTEVSLVEDAEAAQGIDAAQDTNAGQDADAESSGAARPEAELS